MLREAHYIENDREVLFWASGCLVAAYRRRLSVALTPDVGRRFGRRVAYTAVMGVLGLGAISCASGKTIPGVPVFERTVCDLPDLAPDLMPRIQCGTVAVPRDYAHPDRGTFRLAVTVIASAVQPAAPEPDLYISGGPGGPLTVFAEAQARRPLAPDRDQILIDQRGTGASEPTLCPSFDRALIAASAVSDADGGARRRELFQACRTEILASGIDLADFGTTVTVEDFEMVRRALGIASWNVFGVSYGTTVAMTLLALHPEPIRAAVLDSVYPPDPILPPWSQTAARARDAFLAACATAEGCRDIYPNLTEDYRAALARLAATPTSITVPHGMNQPGDRTPLTPALFSWVVDLLTYYPNFYPGLPRLIAATRDGDTSPAATAIGQLFTEATNPRTGPRVSLRAAVECRDRPHFHEASPAPDDLGTLEGICDGWAPLGPPPLVPRDTAVPVLVLAGQFDPNAPPDRSRAVAAMIGPRARWVEFMRMGHSVRAFSACAVGLVSAFIDQPDQPSNTACAAQAPVVQYLPTQSAR